MAWDTDDGEALVRHIRTYYGTDTVDFVVSTHPDQGHVAGLEVVLTELRVGTLLMHQPWRHTFEMAAARRHAFREAALSEKLEKSLQEASDLEAIATRTGVKIIEPFAGVGTRDGCFRVIGPSQPYYEQLLQMVQAPAAAERAASLLTKVKAAA